MRTALTIAGSDSSGGAGVQADLKTFAAFGVYGVSAVSAVTAQSTSGVIGTVALPSAFVTSQIETVAGDMVIHATKTGMLATAAIVEAVAAAIVELDLPLVVVDPVLTSSNGDPLLDGDGVQMLMTELLPHARVVTPNVREAEALSGRRIESHDDVRRAAERILQMGASAVIVTGGHLPGDDVVDLVHDGDACTELVVHRTGLPGGRRVHGTGCTHASALAAGLACGMPLVEAAARAQTYVAGAIAHAFTPGRGAALLDHFWQHRAATQDRILKS
jgi:hydroxymethylpyrimidine/phosphomethylpyrimidine kinase